MVKPPQEGEFFLHGDDIFFSWFLLLSIYKKLLKVSDNSIEQIQDESTTLNTSLAAFLLRSHLHFAVKTTFVSWTFLFILNYSIWKSYRHQSCKKNRLNSDLSFICSITRWPKWICWQRRSLCHKKNWKLTILVYFSLFSVHSIYFRFWFCFK